MRSTRWLFVGAMTMFFGALLMAQQRPATPAAKAQPSAAPSFRPMATVRELMTELIDPSVDLVFDSVSSTITATGTEEKVPKNDEEWATVRKGAMLVMEGANLLMVPGRHIGPDWDKPVVKRKPGEEPPPELPPNEIEANLKKDRPAWIRLARNLINAADGARKAAEAKDPQGIIVSSAAIEDACEACHLRYWYPNQLELLAKADKMLRERKKGS
jgi:hypothetical protein